MAASCRVRIAAATAVCQELQHRRRSVRSGRRHDHATAATVCPTFWVPGIKLRDVLRYLKTEAERPYRMLYDLTAIDERVRAHRARSARQRLHGRLSPALLRAQRRTSASRWRSRATTLSHAHRSPISGPRPTGTSAKCGTCSASRFDGHPHLRRILMPPTWQGHPLRKEHPARATEMGPFRLPEEKRSAEQEALQFRPEDWGLNRARRGYRLSVPQPGAAASRNAWRAAHRAAARRRRDRRRRARHRLPPPRRREDGRAPVVAHLHPLHRPRRLPRRGDEQPAPTCWRSRSSPASKCPTA